MMARKGASAAEAGPYTMWVHSIMDEQGMKALPNNIKSGIATWNNDFLTRKKGEAAWKERASGWEAFLQQLASS